VRGGSLFPLRAGSAPSRNLLRGVRACGNVLPTDSFPCHELNLDSNSGDEFLQGVFDAGGLEAEWARGRFEGDAAIAIDHVEAIGPAGVGAVGGVVNRVHDGGKFYSELHDAKLAEFAALVETFRTREEDVIVEIVGIFPEIRCVRLADVNDIERRAIFVLLVEFVEGGNLPPERRSSVAAEDKYDGLLAAQGRQLEMALVVGAFEREIGRGVADAERPFARVHPERLQRKHEERDVREVAHGAREEVRALAHGEVKRAGRGGVENDQDDGGGDEQLSHELFHGRRPRGARAPDGLRDETLHGKRG